MAQPRTQRSVYSVCAAYGSKMSEGGSVCGGNDGARCYSFPPQHSQDNRDLGRKQPRSKLGIYEVAPKAHAPGGPLSTVGGLAITGLREVCSLFFYARTWLR